MTSDTKNQSTRLHSITKYILSRFASRKGKLTATYDSIGGRTFSKFLDAPHDAMRASPSIPPNPRDGACKDPPHFGLLKFSTGLASSSRRPKVLRVYAFAFIIYIHLDDCVHSLSYRRSEFVTQRNTPNPSRRPQCVQLLSWNQALIASARSWAIGSLHHVSIIARNDYRGQVLPAASLNLYP
jgi:hypothetical protein